MCATLNSKIPALPHPTRLPGLPNILAPAYPETPPHHTVLATSDASQAPPPCSKIRAGSRSAEIGLPGLPTKSTGVLDKAPPHTAARLLPKISRIPVDKANISLEDRSRDFRKHYRGPRQALPGSPTSATGVPSKSYRGAQQKVPGIYSP